MSLSSKARGNPATHARGNPATHAREIVTHIASNRSRVLIPALVPSVCTYARISRRLISPAAVAAEEAQAPTRPRLKTLTLRGGPDLADVCDGRRGFIKIFLQLIETSKHRIDDTVPMLATLKLEAEGGFVRTVYHVRGTLYRVKEMEERRRREKEARQRMRMQQQQQHQQHQQQIMQLRQQPTQQQPWQLQQQQQLQRQRWQQQSQQQQSQQQQSQQQIQTQQHHRQQHQPQHQLWHQAQQRQRQQQSQPRIVQQGISMATLASNARGPMNVARGMPNFNNIQVQPQVRRQQQMQGAPLRQHPVQAAPGFVRPPKEQQARQAKASNS